MSGTTLAPKDFIFRALRDFRKNYPQVEFMPVSLLSEQLKLDEEQVVGFVEKLHEHNMVSLHPMWPHIRAVFFKKEY